jgi:hypothetical protein
MSCNIHKNQKFEDIQKMKSIFKDEYIKEQNQKGFEINIIHLDFVQIDTVSKRDALLKVLYSVNRDINNSFELDYKNNKIAKDTFKLIKFINSIYYQRDSINFKTDSSEKVYNLKLNLKSIVINKKDTFQHNERFNLFYDKNLKIINPMDFRVSF